MGCHKFPHKKKREKTNTKTAIKRIGGGGEKEGKMADTHKMSPEEVKKAGVESSKKPSGTNPGGVLHQRRNLPFSITTMSLGGFLLIAAMGYFTLYVKKKPEASAADVAKVSIGMAEPEDTRPRKYPAPPPPEDAHPRK